METFAREYKKIILQNNTIKPLENYMYMTKQFEKIHWKVKECRD